MQVTRHTTRGALALLAVGALALSGCSGERDRTTTELKPAELLTTTPAATSELDHVTWNSPYGEPSSLDPIKAFNYPENTVVSNLCESLVQLQPDFSIKPNLAASYEQPTPTTIVFDLRDDVTFWDGAPMSAEDVAFSLRRHLDPDEGSYWASSQTENIASVEATGEHQVTITLKTPDATLLSELTGPLGVVVEEKQRKAAGADYGNPQAGVMCTGPFEVGSWKQGSSIVLKRNESYWNADHRTKSAEVEISFILDPTAIANALESGEIDGSYDVPVSAVAQLGDNGAGKLYLGRSMQQMAIISTGTGPFGDTAVRRALALATDREAIAQGVYHGTAEPAESLIPDGAWTYGDSVFSAARKDLPSLAHDVEAAKAELEKAEVDTSAPIKIAYPSERTFYADIINELARAGKEIGLQVEPVGVPSAQFGAFFSDPKAREGYDAFVTTNYMTSPDPLGQLNTLAHTGGGQNYAGFSDPAIDALLHQANATADPDQRAEATVKAEQAIMERLPSLPIVDLAVRLYLNDKVTGVPASFVYMSYPWAADLGGSGK